MDFLKFMCKIYRKYCYESYCFPSVAHIHDKKMITDSGDLRNVRKYQHLSMANYIKYGNKEKTVADSGNFSNVTYVTKISRIRRSSSRRELDSKMDSSQKSATLKRILHKN